MTKKRSGDGDEPSEKRTKRNEGDSPEEDDVHLSEDEEDLNTFDERMALWITIIDVGQGESTLIRYCRWSSDAWETEHAVLVDGGRKHYVVDSIIPTLDELGVGKIDTLVCSHYDADHMEGLTALPEDYDVETVYERSDDARDKDDKIHTFRRRYGRIRKAIVEDEVIRLGGNSDDCPTLECVHVGTGELENEENDASIGLLLRYGNFSFYLGGDLTSDVEDTLGLEHVCAFKCGHHGSKHSTSADFLESIKPSAAFISAANHSYCHPDDETIERLCQKDSVHRVYLTNCVYNRAGINHKYSDMEYDLLDNIWTEIRQWFIDNSGLMGNPPNGFEKLLALAGKTDDDFVVMLETEEKLEIKSAEIRRKLPDEGDEDDRQCWRTLANLYYMAHDMHLGVGARLDRAQKGIVAANKDHLGNIHLRVYGEDAEEGCKFTVLLSDGEDMRWIEHHCGGEVKEGDKDPDVFPVERPVNYSYTESFSLLTGPSGKDRENLTPDEVADLASEIGRLRGMIESMDKAELDAVENMLEGTQLTVTPRRVITFWKEYGDLLKQYQSTMDDYGELYNLKNPEEEIWEALEGALKAEEDDEEDDPGYGSD